MSLSPDARSLLTECAQAIVNNTPLEIDLFDLTLEEHTALHNEVASYLASEVERMSENRLTVRKADWRLFPDGALGTRLHLARCPINTPDETITAIADDVFLVKIGPYTKGFGIYDAARHERV